MDEFIGSNFEPGMLNESIYDLEHMPSDSRFEDATFRAFVCEWWQKYAEQSVSVGDLFQLAEDLDLGDGTDTSRRIRLGKLLCNYRDQFIGEVRLKQLDKKLNSRTWRLVSIAAGERK